MRAHFTLGMSSRVKFETFIAFHCQLELRATLSSHNRVAVHIAQADIAKDWARLANN